MFLTVVLILCPRANRSHSSLLSCSFLKSNESNSLTSIFLKRATISESLLSLIKKEWQSAICSSHPLQKSDLAICSKKEQNALSLFCSQKMSNSLKKPKSEFPTLGGTHIFCWSKTLLHRRTTVSLKKFHQMSLVKLHSVKFQHKHHTGLISVLKTNSNLQTTGKLQRYTN